MDILSSVWKNKVSPILDHLCNTDVCPSVWVLIVPESSMCYLLLGLVPLKLIFHHFPRPYLICAAPPQNGVIAKKTNVLWQTNRTISWRSRA